MADILFDPAPIDPSLPRYESLLRNLQGNILKGHGRDHAVLIFFTFNRPPEEVRPQLIKLLERVPSAFDQLRHSEQFRKFAVPGGLFANFFLSFSGYAGLGFNDSILETVFPNNDASAFRKGMKKFHADAILELTDSAVEDWEPPYQDRIDAMLLLADDHLPFLDRQTRAAMDAIEKIATIVAVERGAALRTENEVGVEHFGYADGRSQPIFLKGDLDKEGSIANWNPAAGLSLVLIEDRAVSDEASYGSFLVFRKLEQDVRGFVAREQALADAMELQGADRERLGAMAVGRFRDGTPLIDAGVPNGLKTNDFDYSGDPDGAKCPFHAHIRKTNPRGEATDLGGLDVQNAIRIARRGMPYGDQTELPGAAVSPEALPSKDVGLLFMCFQRSVETQFKKIQQQWANRSDSPNSKGKGGDALIGQGNSTPQQWPKEYGNSGSIYSALFSDFVKMKGGEVFFAPSIPFLRILKPQGP